MKKKYVVTLMEEGLEAALERRKPRRQYRRKLDGDGEALQRCTLSARSMPGDGQEHRLGPVPCLPIHLLAPSQAKERNYPPPVGHMSAFVVRTASSIRLGTVPLAAAHVNG